MRTIPGFGWFAALTALLLPASPTLAHPQGASAPYTLTVEDEWGRTLRTFHHGGETFVLGEYGTRYQLRVHNRTGRRVEAVISVDGRDAVSGEPGDFVSQRGYVIGAYDSVVVEGFRQSLERVATFRFTHPGDSYSSRMGSPQNVGVIGVAIFPERRPRPAPRLARPRVEHQPHGPGDYRSRNTYDHYGSGASEAPAESKGRSAPAPSAPSRRGSGEAEARSGAARDSAGDSYERYAEQSAPTNNLGTEYGESRDSQVREVGFRRESRRHPAQVLSVRYDDERGLVARGIQVHPRRVVVQRDPEPFPANRFAPPPPR